MTISSLRGSFSSPSSSPEGISNEYLDGAVPVVTTPGDRIVQAPWHRQAIGLSTVLDNKIFGNTLRMLQTSIAGFIQRVTYYRKNASPMRPTDDVTIGGKSSIRDTYIRINDFELKFPDAFQYSYASEDVQSELTGQAVVYSGFEPKVGDFFIMEMSDPGKLGQFVVTNVAPLSVRSQTCFTIDIRLFSFPNAEAIAVIEEKVAQVLYFDLEAYLGDKATLLIPDERVLLDQAQAWSESLLVTYYREFYDPHVYNTFMRPDGAYDPYVLEFITKYLDSTPRQPRPAQLVTRLPDYDQSIWFRIEHVGSRIQLAQINYCTLLTCTAQSRGTGITSLINRQYVSLIDDETALPYLSASLLPDATVDDLSLIIDLFLDEGKIDPTALMAALDGVHELEPIDRFYRTPVYFYMLRVLIGYIRNGQLRRYVAPVAVPFDPIYHFTLDALVDGWLVIGHRAPVLSFLTPDNVQYLFADAEVSYSESGTVHLNIQAALTRLSLAADAGEWSIVMSEPL